MVLKTVDFDSAWVFSITEAFDLFSAKNADYGDSFKFAGQPGLMVRLLDKACRAFSLLAKGKAEVAAESLHDTYIDAANYSLMALAMFEYNQGRLTSPVYAAALDLVGQEFREHGDDYKHRLQNEPLFNIVDYTRQLLAGHIEVRIAEVLFVAKHRLREDLLYSAAMFLLLAGLSRAGEA